MLPHEDTHDTASFLTRGQRITAQVDDSNAREVELRPGEALTFHPKVIHASNPNVSDDRRIACLPSFCPTWAVLPGARDSAMLVRGVDEHHHFDVEPTPEGEMHPAAVAAHHRACTGSAKSMYRDTERVPLALRSSPEAG